MITKKITVTNTKTSLYALLTTAGYVWPTSGNNRCYKVTIQIGISEETASIEVLDANAAAGQGYLLSNANARLPAYISIRTDKVSRIYLLGSAAAVEARILVEQA